MIDCFEGKYDFLSNFYPHTLYDVNGIAYPTNEHYFQAMKTLDLEKRKAIAAAKTPGKAKQTGRKVALRSDWEFVKDKFMLTALREKFSDTRLAEKLLATGDEELVEGNWWGDTYWGVCNGVGENHLGKLLMQVRSEIQ